MTQSGCTVQFVGNATVLLRLGPLTLLTDPNFLRLGQRAYLGYGLSSRRLTEPALTPAQLPALDGIVLSHMHGDHWDRVARRELDRAVPLVTTPKAARAARRQGFRAGVGLGTWDHHTLRSGEASVRITALPGRHAKGPARHLLPPVMGSMLEYRATADAAPLRLYLSGDTLLIDELAEITERFPAPDVALVHLGGTTLPGGLVVTLDGEGGADLVELVRPRRVLPVHHSDYGVFASPLSDFLTAMTTRGLHGRVQVLAPGEVAGLTGPDAAGPDVNPDAG